MSKVRIAELDETEKKMKKKKKQKSSSSKSRDGGDAGRWWRRGPVGTVGRGDKNKGNRDRYMNWKKEKRREYPSPSGSKYQD